MTLDYERLNAIRCAERWMVELCNKSKPIKTGEVRKIARMILKRYPEPYWTDRLERLLKSRRGELGIKMPVSKRKVQKKRIMP
jgi:hypothetical protein